MKKLTKILSIMLVIAMAVGCFAACGKKEADNGGSEGNSIKFGTNAEFPPFEYVTQDGTIGEFDGIDIAIAKQIAEENGMEATIDNMEFDSLIIALQNGQVDAVIAGMTVTEERAEAVDFSTPYYTATQVMIVKEDSDITCAEDMADKKIVVIQGYTGETCVQDMNYEYEAFKKGTEAIMELVNGKCDVVVIDSATAQKYVDDNEGLKIVEDPNAFESEEYAIAVKKGNEELLEKINAAIEKMIEDGTISEFAAKYVDADVE
ncbi:MAG: basic amino acid ABC transporter substrate-binding protein [Clostridiales bacterium]|nr:basic amino acid ABC transporter substrate-binding protein [Clostridiales bacterium]